MLRIVGIGEILWDRYPEGDCLGGAPGNFAFHASQFGACSHIVSRIGDDVDGRKLLAELGENKLSHEFIQIDKGHPTGVVDIELKGGQPSYVIRRAAWDYLEMNDGLRELAKHTDAVCFGTLAQRNEITRKTIRDFIQLCNEGTLRFFDLNLRQSYYSRETIEFGLRHTTVLKLNEDELNSLGELMGYRESFIISRLFDEFLLSVIALTLGAKGCVLFTRSSKICATAAPVSCKNAVGAGDSFSATLVMGLLKNKPLQEIAERANRVGGYVASQHGAMPLLPHELLWN